MLEDVLEDVRRIPPQSRPTAGRVLAWCFLLGTLALTGACASQVRSPSVQAAGESRDMPDPSSRDDAPIRELPALRGKNAARVAAASADTPVRSARASGLFNPSPVAIRARRPASETVFTPDDAAVAERGPTSSRFASWWSSQGSAARGTTELVAFKSAPFPYEGVTPTGDNFLNVSTGSQRGHRGLRGVLWEDRTFSDNRVLMHIPDGFDPSRPSVLVVFFHGWGATLKRDVMERQKVAAQVSASGANAILVAPQFAFDARDSSAGKFWTEGGFRRFLDETATAVATRLGDPGAASTLAKTPVVLVAYSGGFLPAAYSLNDASGTGRVKGVVLLDATYGSLDTYADWIAGQPGAFFVSSFTHYTQARNRQLRDMMAARGVPVSTSLEGGVLARGATFLGVDTTNHADFVTRAWDDNPIRVILASLPSGGLGGGDLVASIGRRGARRNDFAAVH